MRAISRYAVAMAASTMFAGMAFAGATESRFPQAPQPPGNGQLPSGEAIIFSEGFDVVPPAGWTINNQSDNAAGALTSWFQGNGAVFPAHSGASNSYAGANFNNTTGTGTISDWLIFPATPGGLQAGDVVHFWTRTVTSPAFPDRLQLRYSNTGANPGTGSASVGDFSNLAVDINPNLTLAGYPTAFTEFTFTMPTTLPNGRLAFRYFVAGGGPSGNNSDYIGVDTVSIDRTVPEPAALGCLALGGVAMLRRRRA